MLAPVVAWVLSAQRVLQQDLAASVRAMGLDLTATLTALGFAFALGMVHALTPGHGKVVVFSYFLGQRSRPLAGLAMAGKIAFTHTTTAAVLVLVFGAAISSFGRPAGPASTLQTLSYAAIAVIGAYYLWRALRGKTHGAHDTLAHRTMHGALLPFAVGLLPCPLTMLIISFAIANGSVLRGLALAAVVGMGAALTIGAVGMIGIALRSGLFGRLDPEARRYRLLLGGLEVASSAAILIVGVLFLVGGLA